MNEAAGSTQNMNNIALFLFGAILHILAAVDYNSLIDYSFKAIVGGFIWLAFKIAGEFITTRMKMKEKLKEKNEDD